MTVAGDDIVCSCRKCYSENGYGVRLEKKGGMLVCPHDSSHRYEVCNGFLRSI